MNARPELVEVAVGGPARRTFTYHLPVDLGGLAPGQRVLVEFGRSRTVGFYLGPARRAPGVKTKPILAALDASTFFSPELFELCRWMADYYFANPADCLTSALPPALKRRRAVRLKWAEHCPVEFPAAEPLFKSGRMLSGSDLAELKRRSSTLIGDLVRSGALIEDWQALRESESRVIAGYRCMNTERWPEYFRRRRFRAEPFDDQRSRNELVASGWSAARLREAVAAEILIPVYTTRPDTILTFVPPREGVTELRPNDEQAAAIEHLTQGLDQGFRVTLLHGVTGSGKTLVYCHVAREALSRGKTVLALTPEIALTGATLAYFRGFFGDQVTVIHSAMTSRERMESWLGIRRGKYRIVVGPRSALFAPLDNLGLIVVDEEHDSSYKQADPSPRFQGRDAAIMRGKLSGAPVLLGSASPSLESYYHAVSGRYDLLQLTCRPEGATLPQVKVVDMRTERLAGEQPYLSFPLKKRIDETLASGSQAILFLNRRGYSPQLKCADCGFVPACPHCEMKLTYHKTGAKLSCHYCGYLQHGYEVCAKCGGRQLLYVGAGTQKVEEHLARLFEQSRVLRFDSDTASGRRSAHELLGEFAARKHNLLLGTQMVTKGLDLPGVTLVGVLSADQGLDLPDFRAQEKTFSRLLQVSGRSGRGIDPGEVYIQTYYPDSDVIKDAARQDYRGFYDAEIVSRREHNFPPHRRFVRFVLAGKDAKVLEKETPAFAERLGKLASEHRLGAQIIGPAPCPIARLRGQYRRHLLVRIDNPMRLMRLLTTWEEREARLGLPAKIKITVDVDPDELM